MASKEVNRLMKRCDNNDGCGWKKSGVTLERAIGSQFYFDLNDPNLSMLSSPSKSMLLYLFDTILTVYQISSAASRYICHSHLDPWVHRLDVIDSHGYFFS